MSTAFQPFDSSDSTAVVPAGAFDEGTDLFAAGDEAPAQAGKPELLRAPSFDKTRPTAPAAEEKASAPSDAESPPMKSARKPSMEEPDDSLPPPIPVNMCTTVDQLCVGKLNGSCLMRISWRTMLTKSWKTCFWVFEQPDLLLIFREQRHFFDYHKNPFLDEAQLKYITKKRVALAANHRCTPITRKPYGTTAASKIGLGSNAQILYHFTLEELSDLGPLAQVRFASLDNEPLETLRFAINKRIHIHRVDLVNRQKLFLDQQAEAFGY